MDTSYIDVLGQRAVAAERILARAGSRLKDAALLESAKALRNNTDAILEANARDLDAARENGMSEAMQDRLRLDAARIEGVAAALEQIAALPDPVGRTLSGSKRPNGLDITRVSVPLGVIAIIYEARPNVTCDAAGLCLKSGNVCVLRGGKEAIRSNQALVNVLRGAIERAGLPADCVLFVDRTDRETATALMQAVKYIDVLIPRGGKGLINAVVQNAKVPTIRTGDGNCHVYVDAKADPEKAAEIVFNAKTSRVSVCNACETLIIHRDALELLPAIKARLDEKGVTLYADERAIGYLPGAEPATEADWETEYLDYKLAVKTVDSLDEAVDHIERYSTRHSESIVTEDYAAAQAFVERVNSAAVYVNASTRFTDGGEFGFGAEIGISTQKLHARGPVGLPELTSYKYIVRGDGQVR